MICLTCRKIWTEDEYAQAQMPWYEALAVNEAKWNVDVMNEGPSLIAHEYQRLRDLLFDGQTYGLLIQLKDVFEVILKFNATIIISTIYEKHHHEELTKEEMDVVQFLLSKPLSLGDWLSIAHLLGKCTLTHPTMDVLRDIEKFYNKQQIVSWRNQQLGHGALGFDLEATFQEDIEKLLNVLTTHFTTNEQYYKTLELRVVESKKQTPLKGAQLNRLPQHAPLTLHYNDHNNNLFPFLVLHHSKLFFFDSYKFKNYSIIGLDYNYGNKKAFPSPMLATLYHTFKREMQTLLTTDGNVDGPVYSAEEAALLQGFENDVIYVPQHYLLHDLQRTLDEKIKGVIHLTMESGMGKTTFTKALDELMYSKLQLPRTMIRAYYIDPYFGSKIANFKTKLALAFMTNKQQQISLLGDDSGFNWNHDELVHKQFARYLNYQLKIQKSRNADLSRLLFIIDGWDELINNQDGLIDILPTAADLDDGVFILVTSRTSNEMKKNKALMNKIVSDVSFTIERTYPPYVDNMFTYLERVLPHSTSETKQALIEKVHYKFIQLRVLAQLSKFYPSDELQADESLYEQFLQLLRNLYGAKTAQQMNLILTILAFSKTANTIRSILYMMNEPTLTFKLLAIFYDLKSIIAFSRTDHEQTIRLVDEKLIKILQKNNEKIWHMLLDQSFEQVMTFLDNEDNKMLEQEDLLLLETLLTEMHVQKNVQQIGDNRLQRLIHLLLETMEQQTDTTLIDDICVELFMKYREGWMQHKNIKRLDEFLSYVARLLLANNAPFETAMNIAGVSLQLTMEEDKEPHINMRHAYYIMGLSLQRDGQIEAAQNTLITASIAELVYALSRTKVTSNEFSIVLHTVHTIWHNNKEHYMSFIEAVEQYLQSIEEKQQHASFYLVVVRFYREIENYDAAFTYIEKARQLISFDSIHDDVLDFNAVYSLFLLFNPKQTNDTAQHLEAMDDWYKKHEYYDTTYLSVIAARFYYTYLYDKANTLAMTHYFIDQFEAQYEKNAIHLNENVLHSLCNAYNVLYNIQKESTFNFKKMKYARLLLAKDYYDAVIILCDALLIQFKNELDSGHEKKAMDYLTQYIDLLPLLYKHKKDLQKSFRSAFILIDMLLNSNKILIAKKIARHVADYFEAQPVIDSHYNMHYRTALQQLIIISKKQNLLKEKQKYEQKLNSL